MKKTYDIEVDCANCANLAEDAAKKTKGVKNVCINFMSQKMEIEFCPEFDPCVVIKEVLKNCKKVEEDFEICF